MQRWYLIHTKPLGETLARQNLERQQYEVYLPLLAKTVRCRGHWHDRIAALFPRYLFLRLNEGVQSLSPVHSTVGVSCVVRFGAHCTIVPDGVIDRLQARADPNTGLHRVNDGVRLTPGAQVRIAMGPFDGLEGVFEREAGADRVVILLNLLGQNTSVCVPLDSVVLRRAG